MKDVWGCEKKTRMSQPTFIETLRDGTMIKYWNCPRKFIPYNILTFVQEFNYIQNFNVAMPLYREVNPKFLQAIDIYNNELFIARKEATENG